MKKRFLSLACFMAIILLVSTLLTACTKKPWDYDDVIWFSEQPEIKIIKEAGEDWIGYISIDDNEQQILLLWGPTLSFDIMDYSSYNADIVVDDDTALLRGKIKYDKDTVTLVIKIDNIFNNEYETITLYRQDM